MKAVLPDFPLKVFYDGACPLCSREVGHYLRLDGRHRLRAVDISAPDFDPGPFGIPLRNFRYELHAIDRSGRVFRGVDAFRAIWLAFPASRLYRVMASVIALPGIGRLARFGYRLFARLRPSLPAAR